MANDLNQCNFIGRLGKDPEIRSTGTGTRVANFSIAVGWKSKDKEGVEWVNIVAFGKLAEIIGQYLTKGSRIFVSGKQRTRKWQDQSGQDKYSTEIVANELQMLDSKGSVNSGQTSREDSVPASNVPENDFDDTIPW